MKTCSLCRVEQPLENFSRPYKKKTTLYARCKVCRARVAKQSRAATDKAHGYRLMLKRMYGLTFEDVSRMFEAQCGKCAICSRAVALNTGNTLNAAHIDHCHLSDKIRGLLCFDCNLGLGRFKDNATSLRAAADYVEAHR